METVGTPYSLTNGELPSSNHPYSNNNNNNNNNNSHNHHHHHHHNNNNAMGPALNSTPGSHMAMGNGNGNTAHACAGCGRGIQDRFLLHALDRYWHTGCLKCSCCQAQLGEIGKSCFTKAGMILCRNDYIRLFGSGGSCMGCGQSIPASEMVFRAQGNVYHIKCFVCVSCRHPLQPGDRYGLINGSLVCEQDYPKMAKGQGQGHVPLPARTAHKVC